LYPSFPVANRTLPWTHNPRRGGEGDAHWGLVVRFGDADEPVIPDGASGRSINAVLTNVLPLAYDIIHDGYHDRTAEEDTAIAGEVMQV